MSSINDLFDRVQMLGEAKVSPVGKQAPVFKDVPKKMKAAGLAASSRDAMIFITQVLSRLDIISPEVYEMTIKGQHRERMEKLMTILRAKEEEINAKSDEIVEYINQNLDNYTAGAGTDRNRAEKYKEQAKEISQEVQNIKAGKEADDALRDIAVTVAKGLDSEVTDADVDALNFDEADIHINIADQDLKRATAEKIVAQLNANGYEAGVSGVGVNIEAPIGTFGGADNLGAMEKAQDQLKGLVMSVEPSIGENDLVVKVTTQDGTVSHEDAESLVELYRKDMLAEIDKMHKSMVDDGIDPTTGSKFSEAEISDLYRQAAESNLSKFKRLNKHSNGKQQDRVDVAQSILDNVNKTQAANVAPREDAETRLGATNEFPDGEGKYEVVSIGGMHGQSKMGGEKFNSLADACAHAGCDPSEITSEEWIDMEGDGTTLEFMVDEDTAIVMHKNVPAEDYETVTESRYTTADYITDVYANVKPIVESVTVNENGQTTPTLKYLAEEREEAIEKVYTSQYLTEQKASDSLLVPKDEENQSFKERYQPKTSYQLEELRRYGL